MTGAKAKTALWGEKLFTMLLHARMPADIAISRQPGVTVSLEGWVLSSEVSEVPGFRRSYSKSH